jgi:hypothetical protein
MFRWTLAASIQPLFAEGILGSGAFVWTSNLAPFGTALRACQSQICSGPGTGRGKAAAAPKRWRSFLGGVLPGLITGAANDDPCAVGTYARRRGFRVLVLSGRPVHVPNDRRDSLPVLQAELGDGKKVSRQSSATTTRVGCCTRS